MARANRRPWPFLWILASGAALLVECARPRPPAESDAGEFSLLRELEVGATLLKTVPIEGKELSAEGERIGVRAVAEAGTARGVALATLAGELHQRAYRLSGGTAPEEARRALEWWTVAIGRTDLSAVCRPAVLRAALAGELAGDPRVTYRELYASQRRLQSAPCSAEIDRALDRLGTWRPPPVVLEQLDRALAAEGVVGALVAPSLDAGAPTTRARVVRVARWSTTDTARLVVELDRAATYALEPATRGIVRVRLEGVDLGLDDNTIPSETRGLLLGGQLTAAEPGQVAIVLSLARPAYRSVFFLPDPFRVVIDLTTTPPPREREGSGPRPLRRVVLDAGHGGADPGAIGPTGLREKDVTLAIARDAAPLIARELGAEVRLTRAKDTFVSLEERSVAANAFEADVFVSIHCNASESRGRRGIELYVLDTERDQIAARVAARENGGGSAAPSELRAILDDLKLAELGARSRHLAILLQRAAMASLHGGGPQSDFADVIDGGVHGAGFFVLVGARMPAVLIESSFISNPVDEAYLARADYRARLVDAIVNGLRAYRDGT